MLDLINKLQEQLIALNKKVDILVSRSIPENKQVPKPTTINNVVLPPKPQEHNRERPKFKAICADCKKECTIPFKPSGDRPVYCQDCFSRRKVINMSGIKIEDKSKEVTPVSTTTIALVESKKPQTKTKKKVVAIKKPVIKKKSSPKKK